MSLLSLSHHHNHHNHPCKQKEPSDDWTIEHVLQWWVLHSQAEIQAKHKEIEQSLLQQFEAGSHELWKAHQLVLQNTTSQENSDPQVELSSSSSNKTGLEKTSKVENAKTTVTMSAKQPSAQPGGTIHVEITAGEYEGTAVHLQPKSRTPCWVGRSQGKKFKERGISVPLDLEVSTTHGKFELYRGELCYTDTGSTNGSRINGLEVEQNTPNPIESGMEITVGQTVMLVTLL